LSAVLFIAIGSLHIAQFQGTSSGPSLQTDTFVSVY